MIIRNATKEQLYKAVRETSKAYEGNVRFKLEPDAVNQKGTAHRLTLTVIRSANPGGRRSSTGRKVAAACWHVHRDFMKALYGMTPEATIKSALAFYRGVKDFEANFEDTGKHNMGSAFEPCAVRNACECDDDEDKREEAEMAAWTEAHERISRYHKAVEGDMRATARAAADMKALIKRKEDIQRQAREFEEFAASVFGD